MPDHDLAPTSSAVTVAFDCDASCRIQAGWALEQLVARAGVGHMASVTESGSQPDIGYGDVAGRIATLPHDLAQWQFQWDTEPDPTRDPLAFTAWWLARVEEQLAPAAAFDEHGRFRFASSAQSRRGSALGVPVDDLAIELFGEQHLDSSGRGASARFDIVATHDIDIPWLGTRAGVRRTLRAVRDDLRRGRIGAALASVAAAASLPPSRLAGVDPWCNAASIRRLEQAHGARSTSYIHVGGADPHDGDQDAIARGMAPYARALADDPELLGLHGSYRASDTPGLLGHELASLERVAEASLGAVDHRFHYLRHRVPRDWRLLADLGARSDASLGWAEQPGFRAGTAHPFHAWDAEAGVALDLVVIPLAFMDASLDERYLGAGMGDEGRRELDRVLDVIERVGGCASILWHNDRLAAPGAGQSTRLYRHALRRAPRGAITAAEAARRYAARTRPPVAPLAPAHQAGR